MKKLATCTICEAACGIEVELDGSGERVVSVRGDDTDPSSKGYVCPKVVAMQDLHEDPDRLRKPLVNGREASWEEAFEVAAEGLRKVRKAHGRNALAIYQGNPTAHNLPLMVAGQILFRTLGTRNLYSASTADQVPHMRASHEMFGHVLFMPVPDIDRTDHWLVVGANPVVSNGSIMTAPDVRRRIRTLQARGGKLVVVDPRRTETAALADEHVFVRPGSDALLFFALLNVVFEENLAKPGRLAPMLSGLDRLMALAKKFSPERVSKAIGIDHSKIREMARAFAKAPRAACYVRVGTCHQEHATLVSWLAYSLAAVTGNLDREGGLMWATPAVDVVRIANIARLRGHSRFRSRVRQMPEMGGELPVATMADEIETDGPDRIRALITSAGNPVLSAPNGRRIERALGKLDFMVSIDSFVNETTRHANVVLPPCSPLQREHYDLALNAYAVENVAKWVDPPLPKRADEKDDGEIIRELILRMRAPRASWNVLRPVMAFALSPERVVDLGLRTGPYRLSVNALRKTPHGQVLGALKPRLPQMLETPSRKIELAPKACIDEVAVLEASLDKPVPELVLIGRRHLRSNNSWLHNSRRLVKGPPRCTLLVHPDDAARLNLREGADAKVTTNRGTVEAAVSITDEMMPGVVSLPHGWGHHRQGTRTAVAEAHAGVSLNDLTDEERVDRLTGNAAFNAIPVDVVACEERAKPTPPAERSSKSATPS